MTDAEIIRVLLDGVKRWQEIRDLTGCSEVECRTMLARYAELNGYSVAEWERLYPRSIV